MSRNPNWKEEELELALETYLSHDLAWLGKISDNTPEIITLSTVLNSLDLFMEPKGEKFRSVGSIRMKLSNFKSLDDRYGKTSLTNIGKLDKEIWHKYLNKYEELKKKCAETLLEHFCGEFTPSIKEYIDHMTSDLKSSYRYDLELQAVLELRDKAKFSRDIELLNKYDELILLLQTRIHSSIPKYQEHGWINQNIVIGSNNRIGEHVKSTLSNLIDHQKITSEVLSGLLSAEWSRENLHLGHPFFREIDATKDIRSQLKDENGYSRYWKKTYEINGKHYVACKEWFEPRRKYFDKWLSQLTNETNTNSLTILFKELLIKIKEYDTSEVFISLVRLKEDFCHTELDVQRCVDYLIQSGVLVEFQGSTREFNIDDYDLLFKMLNNPEAYTF